MGVRILVLLGIMSACFVIHFSVSAQEMDLRFFSEEEGISNCPNGFFVVGITCRGSYCDDKKLWCRRYGDVYDPTASHRWSRWFSEEKPGYERGFNNEFVSGLGCSGSYCDNLRLRLTRTERIRLSGRCYPTGFFSEERGGHRRCNDGDFVTGIECRGAYCDDINLICCQAGPQ